MLPKNNVHVTVFWLHTISTPWSMSIANYCGIYNYSKRHVRYKAQHRVSHKLLVMPNAPYIQEKGQNATEAVQHVGMVTNP